MNLLKPSIKMSLNTTSTTISNSLPVASFSTNDIGKALIDTSGKASVTAPIVYQASNKLPVAAIPPTPPFFIQDNISTTVKPTIPLSSNLSKQIIPSGALITIAAPTRPTIVQPARITQGKHHLPVRALPINSLSHGATVSAVATVTTVAATLVDPGGGFVVKPVSVQPSLLPTSVAVKPSKAAQHVLMAPGLRTPNPSMKVHQAFASSTYSYPLPSRQQIAANIPTNRSQVSTSQGQSASLGRTITAATSQRTLVPLAMAASQDMNKVSTRTTSVIFQPTSTISISIPARPVNHQDLTGSSRITTASTQGKPLYQVGIPQLSSPPSATLAITTSKLTRVIAASQPSSLASILPGRSIPITASGTPTVAVPVTAFSYSSTAHRQPSVATVTTSAVPVAKIFPQQPQARITALQPSVCGTPHMRTTYVSSSNTAAKLPCVTVTTTQSFVSKATVVTSQAKSRSITQSSQAQPMSNVFSSSTISSTFYTPPTRGPSSIRAPLKSSGNNSTSLSEAQSRNTLSALFDSSSRSTSSTANVAAFTQGQLLHTSSPSLTGKEQARWLQPHLPTCTTSIIPQHGTNSSPKPTILRRQPRADNNITKKLTFEPRIGGLGSTKSEHRPHPDNSAIDSKRFSSQEMIYPLSELAGQVSFNKSLAKTNGLPAKPNNVMRNFHTPSFIPPSGLTDDRNASHLNKRVTQNCHEVKIKNEPTYQIPFKVKGGSSLLPHAYHPYIPLDKHSERNSRFLPHPQLHQSGQKPDSKIALAQQLPGIMNTSADQHRIPHTFPSAVFNASIRPHAPILPLSKDIKTERSSVPSVGGIKREYDGTSKSDLAILAEQANNAYDNSSQESSTGLSPRKKPRKQTHIIAEELPEAAARPVDEEMSTDDADECKDEVPLISPLISASANSYANRTILLSSSSHKSASSSIPSLLPSSSNTAMSSTASENSSLSEFVDKDGIRYVTTRERPPIHLLSGVRVRSVNNHFTHYSDIKVKEKKINLHDVNFNKKRLRGWKIIQFAAQIEELAQLDSEMRQRIDSIKCGLLEHSRSLLHNKASTCESGCVSPAHVMGNSSPGTPCSVPSTPTQSRGVSSFGKSFPSPCTGTNHRPSSPGAILGRKTSRMVEDILKIEEMAQANIQRCNVLQEQMHEAKGAMVKALDQGDVVSRVVEAGRDVQKPNKSASGNVSRGSKKKKT